jgi:hypothetical protein
MTGLQNAFQYENASTMAKVRLAQTLDLRSPGNLDSRILHAGKATSSGA